MLLLILCLFLFRLKNVCLLGVQKGFENWIAFFIDKCAKWPLSSSLLEETPMKKQKKELYTATECNCGARLIFCVHILAGSFWFDSFASFFSKLVSFFKKNWLLFWMSKKNCLLGCLFFVRLTFKDFILLNAARSTK